MRFLLGVIKIHKIKNQTSCLDQVTWSCKNEVFKKSCVKKIVSVDSRKCLRQLNQHSPMLYPFICKNSRSASKNSEEKNNGCAIFLEGLRDTVGQNVISLNLVEILSITITWLMFYPVLLKIQHYLFGRPESNTYTYISAEDPVHWSASVGFVNIAVQMHKLSFIICIFIPSW